MNPYKHTTWIPRRNDVETVVSTWNPRGAFVGNKADEHVIVTHSLPLRHCFSKD